MLTLGAVWANPGTNSSTSELLMERICLFIFNLMWCPHCAGVAEGRCEGRQSVSTFWHFSCFPLFLPHPEWDEISLSVFCTLVRLMIRHGHGKAGLWPCTTGALTSYLPPHPPPTSSTPSSLVIRVVWKTFLSAGGGNSEIRWAAWRLLGLLQGTGSSQTPLILLYRADEGWMVCICACTFGIWGLVFILAWNPECMRHFFCGNIITACQKNNTSAQVYIKQMCPPKIHATHTVSLKVSATSLRTCRWWHNNT